jgi:hypothetical protein
VSFHMRRIDEKLHVQSKSEAVARLCAAAWFAKTFLPIRVVIRRFASPKL